MHFHLHFFVSAMRIRVHLVIVVMAWAIEVNRPYLRRCMLDACSRFIGVGRSTFLLFHRHEFHSAFRTIARMIHDDVRMHRARVFLFFLLLVFHTVVLRRWVLVSRTIESLP